MLTPHQIERARRGAVRDPARTREALLQSAFEEMHRAGFRGADLETILGRAGVTKGAMYHHFASKEALGYAVVDEVIARMTRAKWIEPLAGSDDPLTDLARILEAAPTGPDDLAGGCPLNNIAQEMSPLDEGFRLRTARLFDLWLDAVADALRCGQAAGTVDAGIDPHRAAGFLVAAYEGFTSLGKCRRDAAALRAGIAMLTAWLDGLRPRRRAA